MMEEDISLTAYEFKGYEDSIRASLEQTGLFGEGKSETVGIFQWWNTAAQYPIFVFGCRISYGGRLWSVLQAESLEKMTHEEV